MNGFCARLALVAVLATATLGVAACGDDDDEGSSGDGQASEAPAESGPITIGAAVDQTKLMKFFDGPALAAAQVRAEREAPLEVTA
jgi:hypothetical protein